MLKVPPHCHDSVIVQAFRRGLVHKSPFYDSLTIRTSKNIIDVLQCVAEFIKLKDIHRLTRGERPREKADR